MEQPIYVCEVCMKPSGIMEKDGKHVHMNRCNRHIDIEAMLADGFMPVRHHPSCPPLFKMTSIARLPEKMREVARSWVPSGERHSLLLHGTTGNGKTRTAWCVANRIWAEKATCGTNHDMLFRTMSQLTDDITSSFSDDKGHESLMRRLFKADLLVMDDLGKEKMTARVCADLFAIVDNRANEMLPTIVTTNFNGVGLGQRFEDPEMGVAFVRRLRDYYQAIGS